MSRVPLPDVGVTFIREPYPPTLPRTLLPVHRSYGLIRRSSMALARLRHCASLEESVQVATSPCCHLDLPDVILQIFPEMPEPIPRRSAECMCLVLPQPSSAFLIIRLSQLPASFREHDFPRVGLRGCSYFVMFTPPSLLASQIVPTAASFLAGQPRLLSPSRTCVVTFARIGHAIRLTTGNCRSEDFHLARFAALSAAHERLRNSPLA